MSEQKVRTIVTAEVSDYERGMGAAGKATEDFKKKAEEAGKGVTALGSVMDRMRDSLGVVGRLLPGTAVVLGVAATAAFGMAVSAAGAADEMGRLAESAGISTEAMSELQFAARVTGVSSGAMSSSLEKLGENVRKGSAELAAMGVQTRDLTGQQRPLVDIFQEVIGKLSSYRNDADRARLANAVLGGSWNDLLPLIDQGASGLGDLRDKAHDYGKVISDEAAEESRRFKEELALLREMVPSVAQQIGGPLVSSLREAIQEFTEGTRVAGGFLGALKLFGVQIDPFKDTAENLKTVRGEIKSMEDVLARMDARGQPVVFANGKNYFRDDTERRLGELRKQYEFLQFRQRQEALGIRDPFSGVEDFRFGDGRSSAPVVEKPTRTPRARTSRTIDRDPLGDFALKAVEDYEKSLDRLQARYVDMVDPLQKYRVQLDEVRTLQEAGRLTADEAAEAEFQIQDAMGRTLDMGDAYRQQLEAQKNRYLDLADPMRQYRLQLEELATLREKMPAQAAQWDAAEARIRESMTQTAGTMDQFAIQAARNIQSTLGDGLYNALKGNFDDIGASFADMLTRMAADVAASQLSQLLFGSYGSTGQVGGLAASAGTALRGFFGFADGAAMRSPSLSAYSGRVYDSPKVFAFANGAGVFAEAGAEAIMPLTRTSSGKLGVRAEGMGAGTSLQSVKVEIVNNGQPAKVERVTPRFDAEGLVVQVFLSDWRNNGPMRQAMGA